MPDIGLAFTANCGVSVRFPCGRKVLIDAFPKKDLFWSVVGADQWERIRSDSDYSGPDAICTTHLDPDHYSYGYTREAHRMWPEASLALPGDDFDDALQLKGTEHTLKAGALEIRFLRTEHTGKPDIPHYSVVAAADGVKVLFAGDVTVPTDAILSVFLREKADILLLPFPWCTSSRGREALLETVRPEHLVLVHIPFEEQDRFRYRRAVRLGMERLAALPDVRAFMGPMQKECVAVAADGRREY